MTCQEAVETHPIQAEHGGGVGVYGSRLGLGVSNTADQQPAQRP